MYNIKREGNYFFLSAVLEKYLKWLCHHVRKHRPWVGCIIKRLMNFLMGGESILLFSKWILKLRISITSEVVS